MTASDLQRLADIDTETLHAQLQAGPVVVLLPVGSVEPHGPHLPLGTDTYISLAVAKRAAKRLNELDIRTMIAPSVPYGVTDYASGFAGAISVPATALTTFLQAIIHAYLDEGFAHVCLINNHLEPEQDQAIRAAAAPHGSGASVACPLTRRWARTLSDEFKRGNCHAGQYETSLILASDPHCVRQEVADELPALETSLADGINNGLTTFRAMGIDRAYTGAPAAATPEEGETMLDKLSEMVLTEVQDALGRP